MGAEGCQSRTLGARCTVLKPSYLERSDQLSAGGCTRIRTLDPLIKSQLLSGLSHQIAFNPLNALWLNPRDPARTTRVSLDHQPDCIRPNRARLAQNLTASCGVSTLVLRIVAHPHWQGSGCMNLYGRVRFQGRSQSRFESRPFRSIVMVAGYRSTRS